MKRLLLAALLVLPHGVAVAAETPTKKPVYGSIVDRPLFDPSRKRYVKPPPPPPPPPPEVSTSVDATPPPPPPPSAPLPDLIGVVKGGDDAIAILRASDGRIVRLAKGEEIDGWRIVTIDLANIGVQRGSEKQTLAMPAVVNSGGPGFPTGAAPDFPAPTPPGPSVPVPTFPTNDSDRPSSEGQ